MTLTILIPCLNEEETIGICIQKARKFIEENQIDGEILIADNGSSDNSIKIAKKYKAKIVEVKKKGYGNALIEGTKSANGKYIIMGDADDSYDFLELKAFIHKLEEGYDLVIGNRYQGKIEKGAMKITHKWIGTPILSLLVRKKYKVVNIYDVNCGLRGYVKEKFMRINCQAEGMEYATEMIIKAQQNKLKITEIPINFYKDKRNKKSHLRTIRDGIRHMLLIFNNKKI